MDGGGVVERTFTLEIGNEEINKVSVTVIFVLTGIAVTSPRRYQVPGT